jgi:hypothetical protein
VAIAPRDDLLEGALVPQRGHAAVADEEVADAFDDIVRKHGRALEARRELVVKRHIRATTPNPPPPPARGRQRERLVLAAEVVLGQSAHARFEQPARRAVVGADRREPPRHALAREPRHRRVALAQIPDAATMLRPHAQPAEVAEAGGESVDVCRNHRRRVDADHVLVFLGDHSPIVRRRVALDGHVDPRRHRRLAQHRAHGRVVSRRGHAERRHETSNNGPRHVSSPSG